MLNAERFKEDILKNSNVVFDFSMSKDKHTIKKCLGTCDDCFFHEVGDHCSNIKVKWLLSEYKEPIKLNKVEYEILRYLYKRDYRYITREKSERVIWNTISGEKIGYLDLYDFSNLFQFTNWEDSEPTLIQGVLNNCEVSDGESE